MQWHMNYGGAGHLMAAAIQLRGPLKAGYKKGSCTALTSVFLKKSKASMTGDMIRILGRLWLRGKELGLN